MSAETEPCEPEPSQPWRHPFHGGLAGAIVGLVDAADTLGLGFLDRMGAAEQVLVFACCALLMAAAGFLVGAWMAVVAGALARCGGRWAKDGSLLHRVRSVLSAERGMPLALLWVWLTLAASLGLVVRHMPLGFARWKLMLAMSAIGVAVLPRVARAAPKSRLLQIGGWALVMAGSYFLASRVLYGFSRQGLTNRLHALSVVNMLAMGCLAVAAVGWKKSFHLGRGWRRIAGPVAAVLVMLWLAPMLAKHSHRIRLVLLQRTALSFQALRLGPGETPAVVAATAPIPKLQPRSKSRRPPGALKPLKGVVMIVVDALRNDRVGRPLRQRNSLTPSLDRFAKRAVRFERAYTTQPDTTGATVAMMTGKFRRAVTTETMRQRSLGALLPRQDVRTVAVSSHPYLRVAMGDFETFEQIGSAFKNRWGRSSEAVVQATLRHLDRLADERFFLVTHFYDPHAYYQPNPLVDFGSDDLARYDGEVVYTDHYIGKLLAGIAARGLNDSIAVLVVSDHGEEFGDHRYQRHLVRIYDEATRVCLLIAAPGARKGHRVPDAMSILDIPSTVLDLLGVQAPKGMRGQSLVPSLRGQSRPVVQPVFVHSSDGRSAAVIADQRKLMFRPASGLLEFYDLATDPGERNNLADTAPPAMRRMGSQLRAFMIEHRLLVP